MGAAAHVPIAAPGRVAESDPGWLLCRSSTRGAARRTFCGTPARRSSPLGNLPPREGHDPHDDTPNIPAVRALKDQFWHPDGAVDDVCSGSPCTGPQF